ncbi:MAG: hypothetical protein ACRC9T_00755, partial [Vibrionaceae bacterium]
MHPNQPAGAGNQPATNDGAAQPTNTATSAQTSPAMVVTQAQNTQEQPATAATQPQPLLRASVIQLHPSRLSAPLPVLTHQPVPQPQELQTPQQTHAATTDVTASLLNTLLESVPGLEVAQESAATATLAVKCYRKTASSLDYSLAMRLSFNEETIEKCENSVHKHLLTLINKEKEPYVRLRLLVMAFLLFYSISQLKCAHLFRASKGTIANWHSETK